MGELAELIAPSTDEDVDALEAALEALWTEATEAWPGIELAPATFVPFVAARLPAGAPARDALAELHAADLYLTCACAHGDRAALAAFEDRFMPVVIATVRRMRGDDATADDVAQRIRQRLLVGDGARAPRIADYAGRGDLRRWLRATATRTYLNTLRGKREIVFDDERVLEAVSSPGSDPELAHFKQLYRDEFKAAFLEALDQLSSRDKNLLRYRHVDSLTVDEIAAIYRVHRATTHRWLARARAQLASATEDALCRRLDLSRHGFDSIRRLVESQLELSVSRILGAK